MSSSQRVPWWLQWRDARRLTRRGTIEEAGGVDGRKKRVQRGERSDSVNPSGDRKGGTKSRKKRHSAWCAAGKSARCKVCEAPLW